MLNVFKTFPPKYPKTITFINQIPDLPARGNTNGLNRDDLDDDEDDNEEESDELVTVNSMGKGSRLGGHHIRTTDDSRSQSVLCMYS